MIKIVVYSVKRKKLHAHTCQKYPRTCPSTMTKSAEFFIFTIVFLQPFALSLSFFFPVFSFSVPLFESFFVLYTMVFTPVPPSTCGSGVGSPFSLFSVLPCLSLNLPLLAVRLLVHCSGITSTLMRPES